VHLGSVKQVLIVDDDLADTYLLQKTLYKYGVQNIESLMRGEDAAKYIIGLSPFEHRWLPDLIFIDLKLAGMDGFQLITWIKGNPLFSEIPLVVFSGSRDPADKHKAIQLGAKAFFQKTQEADKLNDIVEDVLNLAVAC
jgi:two-component system, chemotaxis family, response regulator Rcp1